MKTQILCMLAAAGLLVGCSGTQPSMGGTTDTDLNVLTGGPRTGTTLEVLPSPVRRTLEEQRPHSEIADIDKTSRDGRVLYVIAFSENGKNSKLYVYEDGEVTSASGNENKK